MSKNRPPRCDIALLVDEETGDYARGGNFIPDRNSVEEAVLRSLRKRYRRVEVVPFLPTVAETIDRLQRTAPRLVFNLTEWVDGDRKLDAAIAGVLDMLRLPYTGTGPDGLRLARDKALSKRIVDGLSIAVPRSFVVNGSGISKDLDFPLVVKPRYGDGSDGIGTRSVVRNERALRAQIHKLQNRDGGAVICEAFIPGRDLYVGLLGNEPQVLPPVEMLIRRRSDDAPQLATRRLKNDSRYRRRWGVHYRPARLERSAMSALTAASRRIFHALKLRDYARLDYRMTPDGKFYFIEANPNPDLDPHALNRSGCFSGIEYGNLIARIVESARRRR
jgi:D-alanine-D-alanine ligase